MEAAADAPDADIWAKLLRMGNLSEAEEAAGLRLPLTPLDADATTPAPDAEAPQTSDAADAADAAGEADGAAGAGGASSAAAGPTLLRAAFSAVRARRAADARVQSSFEELIAAVRARGRGSNLPAPAPRRGTRLSDLFRAR